MSVVQLGFSAEEAVKKEFTTLEDIDEIKGWQKGSKPQLTDEQIVVFLIACKNNREFAKKTIENNLRLKKSAPNLFRDRNILNENLVKMARTYNFSILPEQYHDSVIMVQTLRDTNYRNYNMEAHFKLHFMVAEAMVYEGLPRDCISIVNTKGLSLMHMTTVRLSFLKAYSEFCNLGMPISIKITHLINSSTALTYGYNLFKPFISSEMAKEIYIHRSCDKDLLPEKLSIPKRFLPEDLGGELRSTLYYHDRTMEKLAKMQPYFDAEEQQRCFD